MFSFAIIGIALIEVISTFSLGWPQSAYELLFQLEIIAVALAGLSVKGKRETAVLAVLVGWFIWQAVTDFFFTDLTPMFVNIETTAFIVAVFFTLLRPYYLPSAKFSYETVILAFYNGSKSPLLSRIGSMVGLPYSSLAIIAGDEILCSGRCGVMRMGKTSAIDTSNFYFIDTGYKITNEILKVMAGCIGRTSTCATIFRIKCVVNVMPVLTALKVQPKNMFFYIPSIFLYQCLKRFRG